MANKISKKRHLNQSTIVLVLVDLFSFCFSYGIAILIRTQLNPALHNPLEQLNGYWMLILFNVLIMFMIFMLMGLYRGYGTVAVVELRNLTISIIIAYIILAFSAYLIGQGSHLSRIVFLVSLLLNLFFVPLFRFIIYNRFSRFKSWGVRVAIIASTEEYANISLRLRSVPRMGFNPVEILCTNPTKGKTFKGIPIKDFSLEQCRQANAEGIDIAFFASEGLSENDPILPEISQIFPTIYYVLPESNLSSLWVNIADLSGRPALKISYHLLEGFSNQVKRTIEWLFAIIVIILTSPLMLIISLLVYLEDKGPVFYTQERLGLNGKPFKLLKFRTMVVNADSTLKQFLQENPAARMEYEKYHKLENDPRITKIGRFLRKFSLDELPQFLNIIHGDMSLVGPRAYMVHELDLEDKITKTILRVRPGMTGWWQVMGRNEATFSDRKKLDLYYISNWSLWVDYYILIKTMWIVLSGQGK